MHKLVAWVLIGGIIWEGTMLLGWWGDCRLNYEIVPLQRSAIGLPEGAGRFDIRLSLPPSPVHAVAARKPGRGWGLSQGRATLALNYGSVPRPRGQRDLPAGQD